VSLYKNLDRIIARIISGQFPLSVSLRMERGGRQAGVRLIVTLLSVICVKISYFLIKNSTLLFLER
jgi:hypothetical protein